MTLPLYGDSHRLDLFKDLFLSALWPMTSVQFEFQALSRVVLAPAGYRGRAFGEEDVLGGDVAI